MLRKLWVSALILFTIALMAPWLTSAMEQPKVPSSGELPDPATSPSLKAVNGMLSLNDWDFARDGTVQLQGDWLVEWETMGDPNPKVTEHSFGTVKVPSSWGNLPEPRSDYGLATYRLRVLLPEEWRTSDQVRPLAIYMPDVATAYTLWIDGQQVLKVGQAGANKEEMVASNVPRTASFAVNRDWLDITIHISNFVQRKGGLWTTPLLGTADQIARYHQTKLIVDNAQAGILIVMAIFHIALFFWNRKEKSPFFFAMLCLAVAVRTLSSSQMTLIYFFPEFSWEWNTKLEYMSVLAASQFTLLYFLQMNARSVVLPRLSAIFIWFGSFYHLFVLVCPASVFTATMNVLMTYLVLISSYVLAIVIRASLQREDGALFNLIGMSVFFICVLNNVLYYNFIIVSIDMTAIGMLAFLILQSLNVTNRFAKAYNVAEETSAKLVQLNQSLDKQVEDRTHKLEHSHRELKQAYEQLSNIHEERRRLFSDISHELGHPVNSIQGYIRGMIDGVVPQGKTEYLHTVYEKTLYLQRIFQDLIALERLESGQIELEKKQIDPSLFIKELVDSYRWDIEESDIAFQYLEGVPRDEYCAEIDPSRIEQVFCNLLFNAKKFTPGGGTITIHTTIVMEKPKTPYMQVTVQDTGAGISERDLPHLFERFYQVRKGDRQGSGLGLAIVKGIVASHGGHVGVQSAMSEGSRFYFAIPVAFASAYRMRR
ncbi:cell wall metabolism sensor histidine kinase WalK [Paenibacillus sp. PAMC21692]|uniref:sensor histidine kinase n=1 Tax=Paenibacillus sp. PAMC21692 TaxID=2762320 RepID=UPI00164D4892|nr:sensor histidine kinase [Paenibacillus sp. PAMC21692]QNK56909.1 sensor histidine kinase [Paenibacillus sp. PAMC21692]